MVLLAQVAQQVQGLPTESHSGAYIGLIIGFAIVVVVVILVATILMFAARIGDQAQDGIVRMDEARESTLPIWELQKLNTSVTGIWRSAESVRHILEEKR
ncbi:MAG: hypothetical protein M3386_01960 [Actinomycetota bacterium]|nr:hypothetical protein [Actinomycetota bacterium]